MADYTTTTIKLPQEVALIHKTFVVPAKWHHFGHVNRFTYLLTYLLTPSPPPTTTTLLFYFLFNRSMFFRKSLHVRPSPRRIPEQEYFGYCGSNFLRTGFRSCHLISSVNALNGLTTPDCVCISVSDDVRRQSFAMFNVCWKNWRASGFIFRTESSRKLMKAGPQVEENRWVLNTGNPRKSAYSYFRRITDVGFVPANHIKITRTCLPNAKVRSVLYVCMCVCVCVCVYKATSF